MAITYNWQVVQMNEYPEFDGEQDVVFQVHWNLTGTETQGETTYTGSVYGSVGVTINPDEPFTPYADLTQEQVLGWVWDSGVDKDASEANVAQQIADQINPPVITLPLPWAQPTPPQEEPAV